MKSFLAIPALFALGAVADSSSDWGFTWTFTSGHSTFTSATVATAWGNATTTAAEAVATSTSWSEWIYTTSYTATYSSGTSTWAIPTAVSYSEAQNFTSMIPAPKGTVTSSVSLKATTSAPASVAASSTKGSPSTFTGAAVNDKAIGLGALAVAGLAFVL